MYYFQKAKPVWGVNLHNTYNQFLGFHREIEVKAKQSLKLAVAARSYYRLYINGEMIASGPARTAKRHCRVDEISVEISGAVQIAVEVVAFSKPNQYCNDCTLETGLFAMEITDAKNHVLAATGDEFWSYKELDSRRELVETMSHSRGIVEWYDLNEHSFEWMYGNISNKKIPVCIEEKVTFLKRHAPYPTYRKISMGPLLEVTDMISTDEGGAGFVLSLARDFNESWYELLPEENCFLEKLRKEKEDVFSGEFRHYKNLQNGKNMIFIQPGQKPAALLWGKEASEIGFIDFEVSVEAPCVIDIINSDHRNFSGVIKANSYVTRYCLEPGVYHLTTFEPKLTKYIKMIFRTKKAVTISTPHLLDDSYPENYQGYFECSDGELNMIYQAARRTLRLSTLDIFMDCPQRERGGWLCDSQFSAQGAWQMFGDLGVERDFIENFMLTDPDVMWNAFFPEVYPGSKEDESNPGFQNWSFWLLTELADYYERSGDKEFVEKYRERVQRFVEGMLSLRGESGLLENMNNQFVDWSLSNRDFCLYPISIPNNCLAVYLLERMAELYEKPEWKQCAEEMRAVIEQMDTGAGIFGGGGDGAVYQEGKLKRTDCPTESGIALEIWSGFHEKDENYMQKFYHTMGTCPTYRSNPNIGKSNLFIGLMIRFDVLARMGKINQLVKEWKDLYLPEIKDGSGTLFENYNSFSGCHGFNGATGALMTNKILGLGQPKCLTKTIEINPHPGELRWACGTASSEEGMFFLRWNADHEKHVLDMILQIPTGWNYKLKIPFELTGWHIIVNGILQEGK